MSKDQHSFYHNAGWADSGVDGTMRRHTLSLHGKATLDEVLRELEERGYEYDFGDLMFSGSIQWVRPATEQEIADRDKFLASSRAKRDEWERREYARLQAKFEGEAN